MNAKKISKKLKLHNVWPLIDEKGLLHWRSFSRLYSNHGVIYLLNL